MIFSSVKRETTSLITVLIQKYNNMILHDVFSKTLIRLYIKSIIKLSILENTYKTFAIVLLMKNCESEF